MKRIYLTRHGQTKWNVEKRLQGWQDSELTEMGIKNAEALGQRLKDVDIDIVYSSTSKRTQRTAQLIVGQRDISIKLDDNLREIDVGSWTGKSMMEIEKSHGEQYYHYLNAPHLYIPDGGEYFEDVQKRALKTIEEILTSDYETILIVTHAVTLKALMIYFEGKPLSQLWSPPLIKGTSLSLVEVEGDQFHIQLHGDTSHMIEDSKEGL